VSQQAAAETIAGHATNAPTAMMPMSTRFMMSSLYRQRLDGQRHPALHDNH
jgi:hypothetical protein